MKGKKIPEIWNLSRTIQNKNATKPIKRNVVFVYLLKDTIQLTKLFDRQ